MGISHIEIIGQNARFFMYSDQSPFHGAPKERVIVAKFVLPIEAVPDCVRKALEATASHAVQAAAQTIKSALHLN